MLERFRKAKAREIAALHALAAQGKMPPAYAGKRPSFIDSLVAQAPLAVIAEYKRASPSKGTINLAASPEEIASAYATAGAGAISVLTEEDYFQGEMSYLDRMTAPGLPLLRKDFILDPLQVAQTAASPASAMLIIVRMLDDDQLKTLLLRCVDFGIEPVTEVFDLADLHRAQAAHAPIIQVNNRDLDTLAIDLSISEQLIRFKRGKEFWITASGIATHEGLVALLNHGFDAALIGSSLMDGENPGAKLQTLLQGDVRKNAQENQPK